MNKIKNEDEILQDIINVIESYLHPKRIILFGSRASGKAKKYSDFDIAVESTEMNTRNKRLALEAIDEKAGIFSVDLIDINRADREFRDYILKKGRIIYEQ